MSRKTATSSTALGFPPAEAAPSRPRIAAGAAGAAGSREALARLNVAIAELKALSVVGILQKGVAALQADDFQQGGELALQALNQDERNGFAWYLLAVSRERAGDFKTSLQCYETALALIPEQAEVANDLGRLAYRLGMKPVAEKLFLHYLAHRPDSYEAANNLACALRDQSRFDEAIEAVRPAIVAHPEEPLLWNTLGTILSERGEPDGALTFFDEALRLDPGHAKARYNRGNTRLALGHLEAALEDCEAAMAGPMPADERLMMRLARSTILIGLGRIAEGWEEYEARLDPAFADVTHFMIDRPKWAPGDDLRGKTVLVMAEQGLGDEVMFANVLPDVAEAIGQNGKLLIAVEKRLVPLVQRSFPKAQVGAHATYNVDALCVRGAPFVKDQSKVDLWAPIGSLLRQFRPSLEAFPQSERFLTPDPARVAKWKRVLAKAGDGPKVGVLWKSLKLDSARFRYFSPFDAWAPVLTTPGVRFVNLQYGDCAAELEQARAAGIDLWTPPNIDLKDDLDDLAALTCALDLVIGPANATTNIAAAAGAQVWMTSTPGSWPRLGVERYPWYPQSRAFPAPAYGEWDAVMQSLAGALREAF